MHSNCNGSLDWCLHEVIVHSKQPSKGILVIFVCFQRNFYYVCLWVYDSATICVWWEIGMSKAKLMNPLHVRALYLKATCFQVYICNMKNVTQCSKGIKPPLFHPQIHRASSYNFSLLILLCTREGLASNNSKHSHVVLPKAYVL